VTRDRLVLTFSVVLLFTLLAGVSAQAAPRDSSPLKPKTDFEIGPKRVYIAPFLTGGLLVGDTVPDLIPDRGRRALYGLGLRGEYVFLPYLRLGVVGEALWGKLAEGDLGNGRALLGGASAMLLMYPSRTWSFFARCEFGEIKVTATSSEYSDGNLGSYPYLHFGLGHQLFSAPSVATRVELYYATALSKNKTLTNDELFSGEIPRNAQMIGLEFSMAFGLL